jgi:uncharacterized membrane protein
MMWWGGGWPAGMWFGWVAMLLFWVLPVAFVLYLAWRWVRAYEERTRQK